MKHCVFCGMVLHYHSECANVKHCANCDRCFKIEKNYNNKPDDEGPSDIQVSVWLDPLACTCS